MRSRIRRTQLQATVIGLIAAVMVAPVSHAVAAPDDESPASATERRHHPVEVVHNAVTDTTNDGDDPVDHTTDALDDVVDHTTDALDDVVDHTTDAVDQAVDRLSDGDSGVREPQPPELPPDSDGNLGVPAAPSTPASPTPTAPRAAGPSGEPTPGPSPADGDLDGPDAGTTGQPQPTPGDPGSLFNGAGGIGDRAPFPLALMAALLAFLGVQGWVDRRDPKLTAAPVGVEPDLMFERP